MGLQQRLTALRADADGPLAARLATHAPTAVSALLVVAIAGQAASVVWGLVTPREPQAVDPASLPPPPVAAPVDVGSILSGRLFGGGGGADNGAVAPSSQNLVLAGTIAGRDPDQGWAILGDSAQAAKVYGTGAVLPGGARLKSVYPDRVILDVGGRLEALMLPRLSGAAGTGVVPIMQPAATTDATPLAERMRQLSAEQPNLLSDIMRPQPVFAGGQQRGYRVYPGRNRQQFAKLGLQPGDLITAVNGAPLDDPNRGMDMLKNLNAGDRVTITIERNGQPTQLNVDASKIVADLAQEAQQPAAGAPEPSE